MKLTDYIKDFKYKSRWKYLLFRSVFRLLLRIKSFLNKISLSLYSNFKAEKTIEEKGISRVYPDSYFQKLNDSFKIVFCGDLLLLEDQVKRGFKNGKYDFNDVFEYTKSIIESADLSIGVLEGPSDQTSGFSTSNYGDGKALSINFPSAFPEAVKQSGFDLVSLANNHILDKGSHGLLETIDLLNKIGLNFIGAYKDQGDKEANRVKVLELQGIKFAVLAYTYCPEEFSEDELFTDHYYSTSFLVPKSSKYYKKCKDSVKSDFEYANSLNPDFIIVLPHCGTQFEKKPDLFQKDWFDTFDELGADIILGDHSHCVQPSYIKDGKFRLYSPGNFTNSFRKYDGDASGLFEIYIDKKSKRIIAADVIPMWICCKTGGNYAPIPTSVLYKSENHNNLYTYDSEKIDSILNTVTNSVFDKKIPVNKYNCRVFFDEKGYFRTPLANIIIYDEWRKNTFLSGINNADSICFIGDSITDGTRNGGVPWYEPISNVLPNRIFNISYGGTTSKLMIKKHIDEIKNTLADVFVIALGTNDIRYRNKRICAMTKEEFTQNISAVTDAIFVNNPNAGIIIIAPWESIDGDPFTPLKYSDVKSMMNDYSLFLSEFCKKKNYIFINPNPYIMDEIDKMPSNYYLEDHIHPNMYHGIQLYCEAVLRYKG